MQSTMTAQLVIDELTMAIWRRDGERMAEQCYITRIVEANTAANRFSGSWTHLA